MSQLSRVAIRLFVASMYVFFGVALTSESIHWADPLCLIFALFLLLCGLAAIYEFFRDAFHPAKDEAHAPAIGHARVSVTEIAVVSSIEAHRNEKNRAIR